jgi:hypothetical protein
MEDLIEWSFATDVLLSKYKLPILTKSEGLANGIESRVSQMEKKVESDNRSYLKFFSPVKCLDTDWNNIPVPLH